MIDDLKVFNELQYYFTGINSFFNSIFYAFYLTDSAGQFDDPENSPFNSEIFLAVGVFFIWHSSLRALLRLIFELTATTSTGIRDWVYLAPLPEL
jgi:hypothetical protein